MGKNKKGKKQDAEKKAALQAKKDAKQDKKARKRLAKQQGKDAAAMDDDDDTAFDAVLQAYKRQDTNNTVSTTWESIDGAFPLARANATLECCVDEKKDHLYLFGGEYFDGVETIVLDDLLRYDAQKQEWKQLVGDATQRPAPRCAHSCVAYKHNLYVFGGEMASSDEYHHYRDLWKFNVQDLTWTEIKARNPPSARSGHAVLVWKSYMIVFGGFFEAARETKWYNDVHVFHLQTETWMDLPPPSRLAARPEPRSACNMALFGSDKIVLHGGFSKLKTATVESKVHSDTWVLHVAPLLQNQPPTWERWMSSSKAVGKATPNGRAGTSSVSYKNRMLVYGGVVDSEHHHHKVESVFYNDLIALDTDRRKWFPLSVKQKKNAGGRRRRKAKGDGDGDVEDDNSDDDNNNNNDGDDDDDDNSDLELEEDADDDDPDNQQEATGWDLDMLRANMFAFVDGDGNIIYEKIEDDEEEDGNGGADASKKDTATAEEQEETKADDSEEEEEEEEKEEEKEETKEEDEDTKLNTANNKTVTIVGSPPSSKKITASSVMVMNNETNQPEAVARHEPLPRINASALLQGHTLYLLGGILEVGDREVTLDDMWSLDLKKREAWDCLWAGTMHKQVWRGAVNDDDDSYISTGKEDGDDDDDDLDDDDDEEGAPSSKTKKRSGLKQEIAELNVKYGLDDSNRTPNPDESLAEFYSRTNQYWNAEAASMFQDGDNELSNKELKRQGFQLAKDRFEELEPVMSRLSQLSLSGGSSGGKRGDGDDEKKSKKDKSKKKKDRR